MGNTSGKAPNGFHLLRLPELLLQHAAFGHVFGEHLEHDTVFPTVGNGTT